MEAEAELEAQEREATMMSQMCRRHRCYETDLLETDAHAEYDIGDHAIRAQEVRRNSKSASYSTGVQICQHHAGRVGLVGSSFAVYSALPLEGPVYGTTDKAASFSCQAVRFRDRDTGQEGESV